MNVRTSPPSEKASDAAWQPYTREGTPALVFEARPPRKRVGPGRP